MWISRVGLELVKAFEGCFLKPYDDGVGVLTIGYGHTNHHLPSFKPTDVWSQADCDAALSGDMETFERHVAMCATVPLKQHEFDALVSWCFNTGGPGGATLWKKLNMGDRAAVPAQLARWNMGGGKVLAGLVRRRQAEGLLFAGNFQDALAVAHNRFSPNPQGKRT